MDFTMSNDKSAKYDSARSFSLSHQGLIEISHQFQKLTIIYYIKLFKALNLI